MPDPDAPSSFGPGPIDDPASNAELALARAALEAYVDAVVVVDAGLRIRVWSPAAERLYGIAAAAASGRRMRDLVDTTVPGREFVPGELHRLVERHGHWRSRLIDRPRLGRRIGETIVVETSAGAIRDASGALTGMIETIRDVTATANIEARLEAFQPLAEATGRARTPAELAAYGLEIMCGAAAAPRGVILTAVDGQFRVAAARNLPPGLAELIESQSADRSALLEALARPSTILTGPVEEFRLADQLASAIRGAGVGWLAVTGLYVLGEVTGMVALGWDGDAIPQLPETLFLQTASQVATVLANARLLDRLQAAESRYRALFEQTSVPILVLRTDLTIADANAAAGRLLGRGPGDLVGLPISRFDQAPDAEPARLLEILRRDGHMSRPTTGTRFDGTTFPAQVDCSLVRIGGDTRILLQVRDLSEQKRLEQELVQAQKMEAIGQLVSGVAHELNNPLAAIVGFSQLIRRDASLPSDLRHDADLLVDEADRTRRIVQSLLDFARQRPPERHLTPVGGLIQSVLDLAAYSVGAAAISVTTDVPDDLPPVPLDRAQIQQVLLNLVTNSVQAIRSRAQPGSIRFVARPIELQGGPGVRLTIADDGPGIPDHQRARLFVPFFTTKAPGEGTGLGLSVSFGIVRGHGGDLSFEPGPEGRGATFHIDLPLMGSATEPANEPGSTDPGRHTPPARVGDEATPTAARTADVLVLDDEPSIRALLQKYLQAAGLEPIVTASGAEAVAAVRDRSFAAVLCDFRMAGMSGTEVYETVMAIRPELADHFVFMSGDVLNPELHAFATARHVKLLAKPFDLESVGRVVLEAIRGGA